MKMNKRSRQCDTNHAQLWKIDEGLYQCHTCDKEFRIEEDE